VPVAELLQVGDRSVLPKIAPGLMTLDGATFDSLEEAATALNALLLPTASGKAA
jgi:hypothetical protein